MSRTGQQQGGAGGGVNTTAPGFYSPMTQPWAFQVPNNPKEIYVWADWWNSNEPKVAAGIEFYTDFPVSGFELECSNGYVKDYFEKLVKKLNFAKWLPLMSQEYHLRGDVFVMMNIDCKHCGGAPPEKGEEPCKHEGASWRSISLLNPNDVEITPSFLDQDPFYMLKPDDKLVKVCMERSEPLYSRIHPNVRKKIMARQPIELAEYAITHLKRGAAPWQERGTSILRRLFPTLAYKDKLRQAQWYLAERNIIPIKIVKVGSDERPANEDDLNDIQDQLTEVANNPMLTMVTHNNFDMEFVGATGKVLPLDGQFEQIDQEIIDGLMLNKAILNGEGPSYSNAQVGLVTMAKRLERFRQELAHMIEERCFKKVAEWNDFTGDSKRGGKELIYPTIKWDDLQLRDDTGKIQMLVTANQNGVISDETLIEAFGLDFDQEVERRRMQEMANMVNSPSIAQNNDGASPGGGMPPMPMPPPGMPPGGPGGAPPPGAGGAPPPMPPMGAPVASVSLYRTVAATCNGLYNDIVQPHLVLASERLAGRKSISQANLEFIKHSLPVNGRGDHGVMVEDYPIDWTVLQGEGPADGGPNCLPQNPMAWAEYAQAGFLVQHMSRLAASLPMGGKAQGGKQNQPPVKLFSSIEQKIYQIILGGNIPYAFYAQYQAGPGMAYQLDGAFPGVKLGIEADSETFHSSPDKQASDRQRDMLLATQGWHILRFTDAEIGEQPDQILAVILDMIKRLTGGGSGKSGGGGI